jgi:diguanylate cyclase (GGDEF)-like protein
VFDGDLTAVVSFIGVVLQLGGEIMLVALFVLLRRYVLRRNYFAAWTAAWSCGAAAILALCLRYFIMPRLLESPVDDDALGVHVLYLAYQLGKLSAFALFLAGTATYVTGTRLLGSRYAVFGAVAAYAIISLIGTGGTLNQLVVWQAPIAVMTLGACGALLFALPASRRTLGSMATASAFSALALLWLVYGVAFSVDAAARATHPWSFVVVNLNTYADLLLNIALGVGMVVLLMEDAKREVDDAQAELRVAHDQLQRASLYDTLTDSLNRNAFAQGVGLEMARGTFGTVVISDLDNLKDVNDAYGHAAGDMLLRHCADILRSTLRPYDKLYRWGGDEFLLVIPSARGAAVETRLTDALANGKSIALPDGREIKLEVSLGTADYTSAEGLAESIQLADEAMYRQKHARKSPDTGIRALKIDSRAISIVR